MPADRFVALGLAHVRSPWFTEVARWSTAGSLPLEFVKCVSAEDVRARLVSGRSFSALLVDAGLSSLDRDLVDLAVSQGCAVLAVDDARGRNLTSLGVAAVLPTALERGDLLDALQAHAHRIATVTAVPRAEQAEPVVTGWRGRLVAVTGQGGAGTSTVSMALAQGLADDARYAGMVALADLSLDADLALLHDARDIVPGVQELVESHRAGRPSAEDIRGLTFFIATRRYHLLLGLRRHRDWATLRPRAFEAAIDGFRRTFRMVVADTDSDLEGENECGSYEVEERNLMARTTLSQADVVVVVGGQGVKGLHGLVRTVLDLRQHGVAPARILPVVNAAGRNARTKAEVTRAFAELTGAVSDDDPVMNPIFLPERRGIEDAYRDGARLPAGLCAPLVGAVQALIDGRAGRAIGTAGGSRPQPVTPGSLGTWSGQEAANQ